MKKMLFGIWLFCLLFSFQCVFGKSGHCGTNVTYTIDGNTISFSKTDPTADAVWGSGCNAAYDFNSSVTILRVNDPISVLNEDGPKLFEDASYIKEMYLSKLDVSAVTDMEGIFCGCTSLKSVDVSGWDTSKVTNMSYMFRNCHSLTNVNMSGWDTSYVMNMDNMFSGCESLTSLNLSGLDTSNVRYMGSMFQMCESLKSLNISGWNTSNVTDIHGIFGNCSSLTGLDLSGWDTSNVESMRTMFFGCSSLRSVNVSGWDTSNVTDMSYMFYNCPSLTSVDVSKWNTFNVEAMEEMFEDCGSLTSLDLSGWDTSKVIDMRYMFSGCSSLGELVLGKNTVKTNIFQSLPNYKDTWYYKKTGAAAGSPLALNTAKENGTLFTGYKYNTMAGTWSTEPLVDSITITNSSGTDITGKTITSNTLNFQLKASAKPTTAVQTVTWKSSNTAVATVSAKGLVSFKKTGAVTITATSTDKGKKTAAVTLKLLPEATAIVIKNNAGTVITGKTVTSKTLKFQLKASAAPAGAAQTVTWKSSNTAVATVNAQGLVTFKKAGTVTITATSTDRGKKTAIVKLKLLPKATKIVIKNPKGAVINGKLITVKTRTYKLSASANPAAAEQKVTWKSSNTNIATVNKAGKVTFKKAGTVVITATSTDRGKKTGKVRLQYKP